MKRERGCEQEEIHEKGKRTIVHNLVNRMWQETRQNVTIIV